MRRTIEAIVATIAVPGTAVFLVPYLILVRTQQVSPGRVGVLEAFSLGIALVGAGMVVWVSYAFVTRGKGTPVPIDPPRRFVADGLFRYVRNPMYVGALLVLLGEALLFRSTWIVLYAAGLWLLLTLSWSCLRSRSLGDVSGAPTASTWHRLRDGSLTCHALVESGGQLGSRSA